MFFNSISVAQNEAAETLVSMSNSGSPAHPVSPGRGRRTTAAGKTRPDGDQVEYHRSGAIENAERAAQLHLQPKSQSSLKQRQRSALQPQLYGLDQTFASHTVPQKFTGSIDTLAQQQRLLGINVQNAGYAHKHH